MANSYWITNYLNDIRDTDKWENLKTIGMVESERHIGEKVTHEKIYYINSIDKQAKVFANAVRGHWGIKNTLHWTLDMTFREDESRIRRDNAAENLAVLPSYCFKHFT